MADITGINLEALGADPVTRGVKFKTLLFDPVKNGTTATGTVHPIYQMPANEAILQVWGVVEEAFTGPSTVKFGWYINGVDSDNPTSAMAIAGLVAGDVFALSSSNPATGGFAQYQNRAGGLIADLRCTTAGGGVIATGKIAFYFMTADVKAAFAAGYRVGDGTA